MNQKASSFYAKVLTVILSLMLIVTFSVQNPSSWSYAGTSGGVVSGEEVDLMISLTDDAPGTEVLIPVEMDKEALQAAIDNGEIILSLDRNDKPYVSAEMYPNQKPGGPLSDWVTQARREEDKPMFKNVVLEATDGGLKVTMDIGCYFYSGNNKDYSAPHGEGGPYIDLCGYFDLKAMAGEDVLGSISAKVVPYPSYHTMDEVYADLEAMAAYDGTRYVEKFSMGKSTAGRDMPYLIIAKDRKTVDDWLDYCDLVETDPDAAMAKIDSVKAPVLYSNIHANEIAAVDGIIDFAWKLIKEDTISYKYLDGFTEDGQAQLATEMEYYQIAIPDLVKDCSTYLGWLLGKTSRSRTSGVVDMDKYYTSSENEYKVDDILEDIFFILVPEENVDGRAQTTREASNGFDLNRDNSFQVTPETANMQHLIGTYNPVSVTEFHGRVKAFQCEPCDPPHEPNFEYDLLAEHLIPGGEAIGIAAVANNQAYNSYVIPQRDYLNYTGNGDETYWADPWDDMSTSYTPQFAMLQGAVAYTVELPAYSEDTTRLASYGILGNSAYVAKEKNGYLKAQAEIFKRGVENYNSDAYEEVGQWLCDQYDVEGAEMDLFRPEYKGEGENGNFYPEAYIIPVDASAQKNVPAAGDMVVWLTRNDVKVYAASSEFTIGETTYPAGTIIVPMYQAKRSVANGALNNGTLINSWTVLYSEGITAFNKTRGFDMAVTAKPADYEILKGVMGDAMDYDAALEYRSSFTSTLEGEQYADVIIKNVSEESTSAVNELLQKGKTVGLITEGEYKGDFITKYKNYRKIADKYTLTAIGLYAEDAGIVAQEIETPKVYVTGHAGDASSGYVGANRVNWNNYADNYDNYAMDLMNFDVTSDVSKASVIVGGSSIEGEDDIIDAIKGGTPYITYTNNAASYSMNYYGRVYEIAGNLEQLGLSQDEQHMTPLDGAMDCLGYVEYPEETLVNVTYIKEGDDIMYGNEAAYFDKIPEGAKVLVKMQNKTPLEGFIPLLSDEAKAGFNTYLDGGVIGFEYVKDGLDVAAFSQTLTNKVHQRDEYQFISNFIFSRSLSEDAYEGETTDSAQGAAQQALAELQAQLEAAQQALAEAQAASDADEAKIAALEATIAKIQSEINKTQGEVDKTQGNQKEDEKKIKALEKNATPAKVKLIKVKKGKKKATVTWKRVAKNCKGYEISITDKKGNEKIVTVKQSSKAKIKKVIKKLKKGTYKVKVRAFNKAGKKVYYGKWSNTKKVKIKKK